VATGCRKLFGCYTIIKTLHCNFMNDLFVSNICVCVDNWLVLQCQMAEEGIMVDSSCCHGGVKGGGAFFVNGPLVSLDPPPPQFSPVERFCGPGLGTQEPGSKR